MPFTKHYTFWLIYIIFMHCGAGGNLLPENFIYLFSEERIRCGVREQESTYKLLCTDLDGTMFPLYGKPDQQCLNRLKKLLNKNPNSLLCYVTGRNLQKSLHAIKDYDLPQPHYLITDVGTRIYFRNARGKWKQDKGWEWFLRTSWPRGTSRGVANSIRQIKGIRVQSKSSQSSFKSSFYLSNTRTSRLLKEMHSKLKDLGVPYTVIISKGRQKYLLLDILAKGASKKNAVNELRSRLGVAVHDTAFAGDSGNDFDLLTTDLKTIVVNNASRDLKRRILIKAGKRATVPTLYFSKGRYNCHHGNDICGVLEGMLHFGMFSRARNAGLYVQIHSIHGLINRNYTDLGRDEDTGGQVVYVVELAKSLSKLPEIGQVDLVTRRIVDRMYPSYSKKLEYVNSKFKIVRIDCGGGRYIKKTKLWPYIKEYADNVIKYTNELGRMPDIIHTNYADAGLAGAVIAKKFGSILTFTGHSLGVPKMQKLGVNKANYMGFDKRFNFTKRLKAEQTAIDSSDAIIVSTKEEIENQYSGYNLDKSKVHVIPPGIDLRMFNPSNEYRSRQPEILRAATKSLSDPEKQMILAVSRLEKRKNLERLVNAFCSSKKLKDRANLIMVTGVKSKTSNEQQEILNRMKNTVQKSGCQGNVSFVKFIDSDGGLPALYHLARKSGGVFINPALIEPFGLTVLEASACGLPVVATKYGGPAEIITDNFNGMLVDPYSTKDIGATLAKILTDRILWRKISRNSVTNAMRFSWDEAARKEAILFNELKEKKLEDKLSEYFKSRNRHYGL